MMTVFYEALVLYTALLETAYSVFAVSNNQHKTCCCAILCRCR